MKTKDYTHILMTRENIREAFKRHTGIVKLFIGHKQWETLLNWQKNEMGGWVVNDSQEFLHPATLFGVPIALTNEEDEFKIGFTGEEKTAEHVFRAIKI